MTRFETRESEARAINSNDASVEPGGYWRQNLTRKPRTMCAMKVKNRLTVRITEFRISQQPPIAQLDWLVVSGQQYLVSLSSLLCK